MCNQATASLTRKVLKTTSSCEEKGIDGKKIKKGKGHIVTDTADHLLNVKVHAANIYDSVLGCEVFRRALEK